MLSDGEYEYQITPLTADKIYKAMNIRAAILRKNAESSRISYHDKVIINAVAAQVEAWADKIETRHRRDMRRGQDE